MCVQRDLVLLIQALREESGVTLSAELLVDRVYQGLPPKETLTLAVWYGERCVQLLPNATDAWASLKATIFAQFDLREDDPELRIVCHLVRLQLLHASSVVP